MFKIKFQIDFAKIRETTATLNRHIRSAMPQWLWFFIFIFSPTCDSINFLQVILISRLLRSHTASHVRIIFT